MKKLVFIGTVGCGKTTLGQAIHGEEIHYKKTQQTEIIGRDMLDTPGEYLDRADRRGALMMSTMDAELLVFIESAIEDRAMFPPSYAGAFAKEAVGVVTKIDLATPEQIQKAEKKLELAGVTKLFHISSVTGEGLKEFMDYIGADT